MLAWSKVVLQFVLMPLGWIAIRFGRYLNMLTHDESLIASISRQFMPRLLVALDNDDDSALWSAAVGQIIADAQFLCQTAMTTQSVFATIGRCSHWLSPHQTRIGRGKYVGTQVDKALKKKNKINYNS